jgi:hypothetical protein
LLQGVSRGVSLLEGGLILLSTPNLAGVDVPRGIKGVVIQVLTQDEIDASSTVKHVNYTFFDKIVETGPSSAEVSLTFVGTYRVGTNDASIIGKRSDVLLFKAVGYMGD